MSVGNAEWHECHVVSMDRATMSCWVYQDDLSMCAVAQVGEA